MGFRAKYFGPNDLATGASIMRAEEVITSFNAEMPSNDISDVIEYYNIIQLFDKKLYLLSWSEEAVDQYSATVKHFCEVVGRFCRRIDGNNVSSLYSQTESQFKDSFIELLSKYKIINRISGDQFSQFIDSYPSALPIILRERKLVEKYEQEIAERLVGDVRFAECVLSRLKWIQ